MAGYRRTISFPAPRPAAFAIGATARDKLAAAYHVRSASLPCRFHPLVVQLDDDVAALRLVIGQSPPAAPSASSVSAAASQVGRVLVSLSELLHHPQAQEPLRRLGRSTFAERLLDDFLRLADAHGSFREALVGLSALQAETRAALRRGDPARLASAARAQRRAGRDLPRLAAAARAVNGTASSDEPSTSHHRIWWVADLVRWMSRAKRRSAKKQNDGGGDDGESSTVQLRSESRMKPEEKARRAAFERHENLERCIASVDSSGEKVFRALVNTRVSLLNILSPSF
ncbi:hypothetical protein OsJ_15779 [Oryza sativa Japonica Group]|uniref:Uncharacterized protein n=1 Tax=Oryza sativa subsp. japonica TaxID=39947 RepID=B9FBY8_ORYSJ|nr:hypothetical protein OsJ_15779 [Oryza sativa Japonica Group]